MPLSSSPREVHLISCQQPLTSKVKLRRCGACSSTRNTVDSKGKTMSLGPPLWRQGRFSRCKRRRNSNDKISCLLSATTRHRHWAMYPIFRSVRVNNSKSEITLTYSRRTITISVAQLLMTVSKRPPLTTKMKLAISRLSRTRQTLKCQVSEFLPSATINSKIMDFPTKTLKIKSRKMKNKTCKTSHGPEPLRSKWNR